MMRAPTRDEREAAVDQAADHLSYLVLSFGLLLVVAWRGLAGREASWDLLGLVILGGAVGSVYRAWKGTVTRRWVAAAALVAVVAGGAAIAIALAARL